MRAYVISYTEEGVAKTFTYYASEPGKLANFVSELEAKGCEIHDIKLAIQHTDDAGSKHERVC